MPQSPLSELLVLVGVHGLEQICVMILWWSPATIACRSTDALDLEVEDCAARNVAAGTGHAGMPISSSIVEVTKRGRDHESPLLTDAHSHHALVPSGTDLAHANLEFKYATADRRVELPALLTDRGGLVDGAGVVHLDLVAVRYLGFALFWLEGDGDGALDRLHGVLGGDCADKAEGGGSDGVR